MEREEPELVFDPEGLDARQLAGRACVLCGKAWPLPEHRVGRLPGAGYVYACAQCAPALPGTVAEALVRYDPDATQPYRPLRTHPRLWFAWRARHRRA